MDIAVKSWIQDIPDIEENDNQREEVKRVLRGYSQPIQTHCSAMDENYKDRVAGRLSFFMIGAVLVQMEHQGMEIIDTVDNHASIL